VNRLVAVVGLTATGKSALGLCLAQALDGEIISCDSTAVYRGIDIGTDKVARSDQLGIAHHLTDVVGPEDVYSAARYATEAAAVARAIIARGRIPILVGGTGLYYRALVRGLFPGPARDGRTRMRLETVAGRRGVEWLHRWLMRVDPGSARRIQPRDRKRLVRALEVYLLTGQNLTSHFDATTSPLHDFRIRTLGLTMTREALRPRIARRVDVQFERGVVEEVQKLLDAGLPATAHALSGLVYRQIREFMAGVRDEAATRELIIRENVQYARRQMVWFRAEPDVRWLEGPGESERVFEEAMQYVRDWERESVPRS